MGIQYRPEIDGLRAIAVVAVVLFHAGIGAAGYVGVDVFFVISGYLITSLLLTEHANTGRIDLLAFYARRVRRIFPAAAFVVLATVAAGYVLLSFDQQRHLAQSAGAALVFGANVFFQFTTGGYWDAASEEMPLLHLWSLSVEEQFYLLWPALLLFTRSRKVITLMTLVSLAVSFLLTEDAAFFQMPARFWELAVGGLIATTSLRLRWASPLGVAVVLAACALQMHVGVAVTGACLVVMGGPNRFLASKPMVGVGLISYSLYLWHWPLLAIYRATSVDTTLAVRLTLCGLAVLLAIGTYRYVEQPFRRLRFNSGRTVAAGAALSATLALSACAVALRDKPAVVVVLPHESVAADFAEKDRPSWECEYRKDDTTIPRCPDPDDARTALWGDSMATAWSPSMRGPTVVYSRPDCPPIIGYVHRFQPECLGFNDAVSKRVAGMETVYLAGQWRSQSYAQLAATVDRIAPTVGRVVIIGPTPVMRAPVPKCLRTTSEHCGQRRDDFDEWNAPILATFRAMAAKHSNVYVVDLTEEFCNDDECPPVLDGIALYWDEHHVSSTQARRVSRQVTGAGMASSAR